jgi:hypothetical protein
MTLGFFSSNKFAAAAELTRTNADVIGLLFLRNVLFFPTYVSRDGGNCLRVVHHSVEFLALLIRPGMRARKSAVRESRICLEGRSSLR